MSATPTAVALVGYNRPAFFRPTLRSILTNAPIANDDLWCFLDGGPESSQDDNRLILDEELASAAFSPRTVKIIERTHKLGCGKNLIDVRRRLFDQEGYERVFLFEDDLVVGPHYLGLCERLLDWAHSRYSDIGVVQAYNPCWFSKEEKVCRLDEVEVGNPHWWGYLMPRETWSAIRDTLYEYEQRFLQVADYEQRNNRAIREWALEKLREKFASVGGPPGVFSDERCFPRTWTFQKYFGGGFCTSQDSMTVLGMTLAGRQKLVTTVNRARPIGSTGLHFSVERFMQTRLNEIELDVFDSDATRRAFRHHVPSRMMLAPRLQVAEVEAIRSLIRQRRPRRVLELGCGGSTLLFAREEGIRQWWSVEDSLKSIDLVHGAAAAFPDLDIKLVHCPQHQILERLEELLPLGFDMFFVNVPDCAAILQRLRTHLQTANGCVLLRNEPGLQNYEAMESFPRRTLLSNGNGQHQGLALLEVAP